MILYQAIKNFILAIVVCRKYGLAYKPFCLFINSEYDDVLKHIKVNPFHTEFNSVLFHELGHHIHHKLVDYTTFFDVNPESAEGVLYDNFFDFHKILESEAFASRFALKTGRADKAILVKAFVTHAQYPFKVNRDLSTRPWFSRYIDCISRNTLRITNI